MNTTSGPNAEQAALWNGPGGQAWVDLQATLDRMFQPFEALLAATVPAGSASRVLDIGCGTGATTRAIARRLAAPGHCTGIDLSAPMIEVARERAEREGVPARFVLGDAQRHAFEPGSFDAVVSRFGVMFFDDPVRAFAHLRQAARGGATLCCIAWRSAAENPFMTTAERAAAPLLPALPARVPGAPGQFAWAERERIERLLDASGWTAIEIAPIDVVCTVPELALLGYITTMGPVGRALPQLDAPARSDLIQTVRAAFDPFVDGDVVRFTAACWQVVARAPTA